MTSRSARTASFRPRLLQAGGLRLDGGEPAPDSIRGSSGGGRSILILTFALARLLSFVLVGATASAIALDHFAPAAFASGGGGHDGGGDGGSGGGGSGGGGSGGGGAGGGSDSSGGGSGGASGSGKNGGEDGSSGSGDNSGGGSSGSGTEDSSSGGAAASGGSPGQHGGGFEPGEIVVMGDRASALADSRSLGFRLIEERPLASLGLSVLKLATPPGLDPRQSVALLHARFPDLTADVNSLYAPYETRAAEVVSLPAPDYAQRMIRWPGGASCGAGLSIGMIDSGLAADAPALADRTLQQRSFLPGGSPGGDPSHGTAIAALLVGTADPAHLGRAGLLPAARLYAAAVFERRGSREVASALAIAEALDWMVQNRVPVVNASLSGEANQLLALAVSRAAARGSILLAAAGNGGPNAPPAYPAALPEAIAVTAVDQNGAVFADANRGDYIALAAPGVRIWVPGADGRGRYQSGTSFAVPFALGAAAIELLQGAPADAADLRRRLAAHARPLGPGGRNPVFGYGLVQAGASCPAAAVQ